jgi:S1-C subfamily serine protease
LMKKLVMQRKYGKGKGFLGIQMSGVLLPAKPNEPRADRQAVQVDRVLPDTPAQKFGLRAGDLILRVDDVDLSTAREAALQNFDGFGAQLPTVTSFSDYIKSKQPGEEVNLHLLRDGEPLEIEVALMKLSADRDPDHRKLEQKSLEFFNGWFGKMNNQ